MQFDNRLLHLLEERGITAYRLSKDTGIPDSMLKRWKSGDNLPSLEKAVQLADYFEVSIDYLVGRTDNPKVNE